MTGQVSASRHLRRLYTGATVPIALLTFDFDPILRLGDGFVVRWWTVTLATLILVVLAAAGVAARRAALAPEDLLYVAVGAVPGAVVGGRLGDVLVRQDAYGAHPLALLDPAVGGLELGLAVVGGVLTAACVAMLLGAPLGRWAHLLAVPLLVTLGAGKLTMALGGAGQGLPLDAAWATAYVGPGPWGSLAPDLPSHPAQIYEGVATLVVALAVLGAQVAGAFRIQDGRLLLLAVAGWAAARTASSATWRDPTVLGAVPAAGVLALAISAGATLALFGASVWIPRRRAAARVATAAAEPAWPDPETRTRF